MLLGREGWGVEGVASQTLKGGFGVHKFRV